MPGRRRLRRWKRDAAAFASEALGLPLVAWQADDLRADEAVFTAWLRSRQGGKSRDGVALALHVAATRPGSLTLFISGGGDLGSRRHLAKLRGLLARSEVLRDVAVDESGQVVVLSNGSTIRCLPASVAAVVGWSADLIVADEAQLIPRPVFEAALPVLSARSGSRLLALGTASAADGWWYDLCRRGELGDPGVAFRRRVTPLVGGSDAMPWLVPSVVSAAVAALGRLRADAEYGCVWASAADLLFPRHVLDLATVDYPSIALVGLRPAARFLAGVDWAHSVDLNALVAIGRVPGERVLGVACAERWDQGHPPLEVAEEVAGSAVHFDTIVSEVNGIGGPCTDHLFKLLASRPRTHGGGSARPVLVEEGFGARPRGAISAPVERGFASRKVPAFTSAPYWATAFGGLRLLMERGLFKLPTEAVELRRELALVTVELGATGEERVGATGGHLGDLAAALALASCPYRARRGGPWRHLLTELADGVVLAPAGHVEDDSEVPTWQSVRGRELTAAPGADPAAARPEMIAATGGGRWR